MKLEVGAVLPFDRWQTVRYVIEIEKLPCGHYSDGYGGKWSSLRYAAESHLSGKLGKQANLVTLKGASW